MDAVFTNGSVASSLGVTKMADLSKEAILQAITDQDLRFLAVSLHVFTKNVSGTFLQNLIFSDRRQYFLPECNQLLSKAFKREKKF